MLRHHKAKTAKAHTRVATALLVRQTMKRERWSFTTKDLFEPVEFLAKLDLEWWFGEPNSGVAMQKVMRDCSEALGANLDKPAP